MNMTSNDGLCTQGISSAYFQQHISISQSELPEKDQMKYEVARLNTFFNRAPCDSCYYGPLAQAGFYCDNNDFIICSYCDTCFPKLGLAKNHIERFTCTNAKCKGTTTWNVPLSPAKDAREQGPHTDLLHQTATSSLPSTPHRLEDTPNENNQKSESLSRKDPQQIKCQDTPASVMTIEGENFIPSSHEPIVSISDARLQFILQTVENLSQQNQIHGQRNYELKETKPSKTAKTCCKSRSEINKKIKHAIESLQCQQNEHKDQIRELQIKLNQTNRWLDIIIDAYQKLVEQRHLHELQEEIKNIKDVVKKVNPLQIIKEHQRARHDKMQTETVLRKTIKELQNTLIDKNKLEQSMRNAAKELERTQISKENLELDFNNVSEELLNIKRGKTELEQDLSCFSKMYKDMIKSKDELENELLRTKEYQKMLENELKDVLNSREELGLAFQGTVIAKDKLEEEFNSVSHAFQSSLENSKQLLEEVNKTKEHCKLLEKSYEDVNKQKSQYKKTAKELYERVDRFTCQICCAGPIESILQPCRHACCEKCTLKIMKKYECPFCRGKLKQYSNIILP